MFTYAAASTVGPTGVWSPYFMLRNSAGANLYAWGPWGDECNGKPLGDNVRWEMQMVGGEAYFYGNGFKCANSTPLSVNPSFLNISDAYGDGSTSTIDDYVIGETENKYVFGNPEEGKFKLVKDMVTPASTGFAFINGTIVNSNNMTSSWSRSNLTYLGNQTVVLENLDTGVIYGTVYTGVKNTGTIAWPLADVIFNSGAPYGRYVVTIPGSGAVSEEIWYLGSGATISFDKDAYSGQDTATLTYSVLGAYWDTSTYSYSIDVVSGTTGATLHSEAISASSGTSSYTFASTDPLGVYYGIVKATKHSDGSVIWMNYDYSELTSYVTITGYVNDAETGLPISGAKVNITQSSIKNNLTTIADGNYSATYYLSGAPITIDATEATHRQYLFTFTPLIAKTIAINISLINNTPVVNQLGIGGIAHDSAYGQPLSGVAVVGVNLSATVTNTSTFTGYYLLGAGDLLNQSYYNTSGSKAGYSNSSTDSININGSVSNFTHHDLWLAGQYLQTFTITDSGTLAAITNVTIVSSSGKSYITTNGTGYLTEPFGLYTVTFSSTGYAPRTITYVFDADASHAVSMTPAAADASSSYNTWYTPWQVRIRIVDLYGKPLPETSVSASYIATTLPSTDPTWLVGAYGVSDAVAADMLNSSVAMSGTTDDNGGLVFTAFKSIQYLFTITNATSGVLATKKIYPSDPEYVIYVRTTGQTSYNNTLATRNASLPWYSINSTALMMGMEYTDSSVCTSQVMFRVWFRDNGTEVHNTTWSGFGGTKILDNHTILKAPIGTEYLWGYNATTVC